MTVQEEPLLARAARWLTLGSVVLVLVSIAASQILLALAVAALLLSGQKLRLPRIWLPLALFMAGTVLSLALSPDPSAGLPQIRKFFVFLTLLAVYSTVREMRHVRLLCYGWFGTGAVIAARGCIQFAARWHQAHAQGRNFYESYVGDRITGFMSHWMTYSGEEMIVFLMLLSFVLFGSIQKRRWVWWGCLALIGLVLFLGWTRSIWVATAVGAGYLAWARRGWVLIAVPAVLLAGFAIFPERVVSLIRPRGDVDSNQHRIVTWRTGLAMIERHPWLGLGPEGVGIHFQEYVPSDIPRPLPTGWYGHLHNVYLHYAAERGILTMLMLVWALLLALFDFWRGVGRSEGEGRFLLHGAVATVAATMVAGCFELNLGDSEVLTLFLAVVGCGYACVNMGFGVAKPVEVVA